jgi:YfiH family protein
MEIHPTGAGRTLRFQRAPAGIHALTTTRDVACDSGAPAWPDARLLADLGLAAPALAWCAQIHGAEVLAVTTGGRQGEADALVTDRSGVVLSVRTADCVPVFLAEPRRGALGLVHAGWRGAAASIVTRTVEAMHALYAADPSEMWAGIGPAIGRAAYEVGGEVARAFPEEHLTPRGDRWLLDLPGAVETELARSGVVRIEPSHLCTFSQRDLFFSYRRDGTSGRLYSLLWRPSGLRAERRGHRLVERSRRAAEPSQSRQTLS